MTEAAYRINGSQVAREAFYALACDPARSIAVEACAGAGKTWMLVSRILRALLDGCAPQDILAITFTKKAAGEMRDRLNAELRRWSRLPDGELAGELRARGLSDAEALRRLPEARSLHTRMTALGRPVQVRTFHSWFAALLRSAPLGLLHQLGLPTTYELLENDAKAIAQVWRRFHTRIAQDQAARADYLEAVAVYGRHGTLKALEAAIHKRTELALADAQGVVDASVAHFTVQFPAMAAWAHPDDRLQSEPVQALLWASAKALGGSTLKTCVEAGAVLEQALSAADTAGIYKALFTESGSPRKLSEKVVGIATVREAQALLADTRSALEQHQAWLHQQRMARLSRGLLQDYAALKRERGWIDMADLEQTALRLLSDETVSGWVQERLDGRIKHLLIDEFQDTNPLQWQALFAWLEGYGGNGAKPGVFVVGDPKQSIYRFRRAEPQVFEAAKNFVRDGLQGDVLSCDHTRRNAQAIIQLVNTAMLGAQAAGEFRVDVAHRLRVGDRAVGPFGLAHVPQAATVGADLIRHDQAHEIALPDPAHLDAEIGKPDAHAHHHARQEVIHPQCQGHDIIQILLVGPAKGDDMLFAHQGRAQTVVLVVILHNRARQRRAFGNPQPGRDIACGKVPHHHLDGDDLGHAHQLLAHVQTADEMRGHPHRIQPGHEEFRQAVVQHALPFHRRGGGDGGRRGAVILEILDQSARLGAFVQDLRLALVNLLAPCHELSATNAIGALPEVRPLLPAAIEHAPPTRKAATIPLRHPCPACGPPSPLQRLSGTGIWGFDPFNPPSALGAQT